MIMFLSEDAQWRARHRPLATSDWIVVIKLYANRIFGYTKKSDLSIVRRIKVKPTPSHYDPSTADAGSQASTWELYKRIIFLAVGAVAFLIVFASFINATLPILLLLFLCVLLAIGVRGMADWLAHHTPLIDKVAVGLVVIVLLSLSIAGVFFLGPPFIDQLLQLNTALPEALNELEAQIQQYPWGQQLLNEIPSFLQLGQQILLESGGDIFSRFTVILSSARGVHITRVGTGHYFVSSPRT